MSAAVFTRQVRGRLIVSCQPVVGGPFDAAPFVVAFARAALAGGAAGLRIEGLENIAAVRAATDAPVIGLLKRDLADSPVRITPTAAEARAIVAAGADMVAFDATRRGRPEPVAALAAAIRDAGALSLADCATVDEGYDALAAGADFVGSTLSGYTGGPEPEEPDLALVAALAALCGNVVAEGRIRTPNQAAAAIRAGALTVVVGSAITRPEMVTGWFAAAIAGAVAGEQPAAEAAR